MSAHRSAPFQILCLEPDRDLRELYAVLLAREGVTIASAANPLAPTDDELGGAIGVLLDPFPIWDDLRPLLTAMRTDPTSWCTPVLVISADMRRLSDHATELADLNCAVLPKPFDVDAFDGWVQHTVRAAQVNAA